MTTLDSDPKDGTTGAPNPADSASAGDQPASNAASITKAEFDALLQKVSQLESLTRSEKDRAVKKTNERLDKLEGDLKPVLERALELARGGKSTEEALTIANSEQEDALSRKTLLDMAKAWQEGKLFTPPSGNGSGQNVNVAEVISKAGLDASDPFVAAQLQGKSFTDEAEAKAAAFDILAAKRASPDPNPAQSAATPAGAVSTTSHDDDLAELQRLQKNPTRENASRRTELVKKLREASQGA